MTVAVLNDIHGNIHALEAVLSEPEVEAATTIVLGGDLIPGPNAVEAVALVRELGPRALILRGSGERTVCAADIHPTAGDETMESWVKRRLDVRDIDKLRRLPLVAEIDSVLFCHATPTTDMWSLGAETSPPLLGQEMRPVTSGTIVVGHSHTQFDHSVGELRIVGSGSVGLPSEPTQGACWVLVDGPQVYHRTTPYEVENAIASWQASGYPDVDTWCHALARARTRA